MTGINLEQATNHGVLLLEDRANVTLNDIADKNALVELPGAPSSGTLPGRKKDPREAGRDASDYDYPGSHL